MIAGIDASTKSSGLALPDGRLLTIAPRAKAAAPGRRLDEIEREAVRALRLSPPLPRLVVIEGPAPHSIGILSTIATAKVRAVLELALFRLGVPWLEISPSSLKRYATGNGQADKSAMIETALDEIDSFDRRITPANDDEADAYWLRHLGRAAYGLEPLTVPHRLEIVASITWPTIDRSTP